VRACVCACVRALGRACEFFIYYWKSNCRYSSVTCTNKR